MAKIKKHISISYDIDNIILNYSNRCNITFSEAVSELVKNGLSNIELNKTINSYNGLLDRISSKLSYNTLLLEQFYSDMEIDELTNPNKSKGLEKFKNKFNKSRYDN